MPHITYVEHDGQEHPVDIPVGDSIMEGAVNNGIPGIDADCGGVCSCATCHVYISKEWAPILAEKTEVEESMLEFASQVREESRLSCQLRVDERFEGLIVRMPEAQF
jgi:2Fe-2S ferredoxin